MNLIYSNHRWNLVKMLPANIALDFVKFVCSATHLMIAIMVLYQIHIVDCETFLSSLTAKAYNTSDGRLCYMCSPGQHLVADCIRSGEVARCEPCKKGFFQTVENVALTCQQCTKDCTQQNQKFIEVCNSTRDNICQCSSGYFKLNEEGFCKKHRTCVPGQGVKSPGNKDRDTICESCIAGKTFSANESATEDCLPCTRCDIEGLYEMTPCTIKSDAHCVSSRPPDGPNNISAIVAGTVVSLIVVIVGVLVVVWYCKRHKQKLQRPEDGSESNQFTDQSSSATANSISLSPEEMPLKEYKDLDTETENIQKLNGNHSNSEKSNHSAGSHTGVPSLLLNKLSKDLISNNWVFFFRELLVAESQIAQARIDHSDNIQEQIYQLLLHSNQLGSLTKTSIVAALKGIGRNDLAAKYTDEEFSDI
ncbi:hypothetical protein CHS0354_022908 [Potamilus streckersoni]|uniref:Tumor necrosis factor receptor superfamily member 16 n=1 Tax=Potamilus streckersoni TaxID=2493646 RepID=A0AAE0VP48_9BIVA|nr:hypothetical protein CHS0354_022908 [Potamilus streckersoni]